MNWKRALIPPLIGWIGAIGYWIGSGPEETPDARADVAIVLGASVDDDTPSPVFQERIAHGIALFEQGRVDQIIFTGAQSDEDSLAESAAARAMALEAGVPDSAILTEDESTTTMHNLVEAQLVMSNAGHANAIIVSDPLHMRRAMEMAEALGIDAQPSATPTTRYQSFSTKITFLIREIYFMHHFWLFGE